MSRSSGSDIQARGRTGKRLTTRNYYFSVEGETEKWYLEHLAKLINQSALISSHVKFEIKVEKNPVNYVKRLSIAGRTTIWHLCDVEGEASDQRFPFIKVLDMMGEAKKLGKDIIYELGYSNLAFDLWMILHKGERGGYTTKCSDYLKDINRLYGKAFERFKDYKKEDHFKACLTKITLDDVWAAIGRGKRMMKQREQDPDLRQVGRYKYCSKNPALSVWIIIEKVLTECGLKALDHDGQ